MDKEQVRKLMEENPTVRALAEEREILWLNSKLASFETARGSLPLSMADVDDAEARLARFAPFIMKKFPETAEARGIIESELREAAAMKERLCDKYGAKIEGRLFVKMDGDLPIAGSIKARGGIYEVLKHTEELALEHGLLREGDSYEKLASDEARKFFSQYTMQVGSTGNLGLSIGIMSAAVGYNAVVHMSADARAWKKALLRSHGVKVIEYDTDYSEAVKQGRVQSDAHPNTKNHHHHKGEKRSQKKGLLIHFLTISPVSCFSSSSRMEATADFAISTRMFLAISSSKDFSDTDTILPMIPPIVSTCVPALMESIISARRFCSFFCPLYIR